MKKEVCQSCGIPMNEYDNMCGTNEDGSLNQEFCKNCYTNGQFSFHGSMEEMVEVCLPHLIEKSYATNEDDARSKLKNWLPTLKRWR